MPRVRFAVPAALACAMGAPSGSAANAQVRTLCAPGKPQVEFACGEIGAALKAKGEQAVSEGLDALAKNAPKRNRESIRIVIAESPEESRSAAESLDIKPLAPHAAAQAYAIRKQSIGMRSPPRPGRGEAAILAAVADSHRLRRHECADREGEHDIAVAKGE